MSLKLRSRPIGLLPYVFCIVGTYVCFAHFLSQGDAISGDTGDARFNALLLEHTWLWLKGVHASFFNAPIFYPHLNTFAYSDYLLGAAPIYWFFRAIGLELLLSFQLWLVVCSVLNFTAFYFLLKRILGFTFFFGSLGAYVFSFSLPRAMHLEHAQLNPEFYVVLSAIGALQFYRNPEQKRGLVLFLSGIVLQLLTAFYFFWFWIWALTMLALYTALSPVGRIHFREWIVKLRSVLGLPFLLASIALAGAMMSPFLYHYALVAKELGMRPWVPISDSIPRLYSWLFLPENHWQYAFLPFRDWMLSLPHRPEHYLSFGMLTWSSMLFALVTVYRQPKLRYLSVPVLAMLVLTLTSGRFSTWILMTYLFPAGGAIRAVGRIQVFMLLFWAPIFCFALRQLWDSKNQRQRALVCLMVVSFFIENIYTSNDTFSRAASNQKVERIVQALPATCEVIVYTPGFHENAYSENLDATQAAYLTGRMTMNGYSGNQPKGFADCFYGRGSEDSINCWLHLHSLETTKTLCKVD